MFFTSGARVLLPPNCPARRVLRSRPMRAFPPASGRRAKGNDRFLPAPPPLSPFRCCGARTAIFSIFPSVNHSRFLLGRRYTVCAVSFFPDPVAAFASADAGRGSVGKRRAVRARTHRDRGSRRFAFRSLIAFASPWAEGAASTKEENRYAIVFCVATLRADCGFNRFPPKVWCAVRASVSAFSFVFFFPRIQRWVPGGQDVYSKTRFLLLRYGYDAVTARGRSCLWLIWKISYTLFKNQIVFTIKYVECR